MADLKTKFKFKQIDKELTADVDITKKTGNHRMLKLDTANSLVELGKTAQIGVKLEGALSGTSFKDEDNMASDSDTAVASQQSIKAYVDAQMTGSDLDFQGDAGGALSIDLDSEVLDIAGGVGITTTGSGNELSVAVDATQAGITSILNNALAIGRDATDQIKFSTDNDITFRVDGNDKIKMLAAEQVFLTTHKLSFHDAGGGESIHAPLDGQINIAAGTKLRTVAPQVEVDASSSVIFDTPTLKVIDDSGAGTPNLTLEGDHTGNGAPRIVLNKDRGGGNAADGEDIGFFEFKGNNGSGDNQVYGSFLAQIKTASNSTDNQERGKFTFGVQAVDGEAVTPAAAMILEAHATSGRIDATIGLHADSEVTLPGELILGTDLAILHGGTGASNASGARTNLGLAIGTNVQAYDAELAAIAGLVSAANKGIQFTGSGTAGMFDLSAFGKTIIDDADAPAARTTLGLGSMATQAHGAVDIDGGAIDGATIGGATPAAGSFDGITLSSGNLVVGGNALSDTMLSTDTFAGTETSIPTAAAVKKYVDGVASGLDVKESVVLATTENIDDIAYGHNLGSTSQGQLLYNANGFKYIDGKLLDTVGMRILIKDQTASRANGFYVLTEVGSIVQNSKLQLNVLAGAPNMPNNQTLQFTVDTDGVGGVGAGNFTITFKNDGTTSSGSFAMTGQNGAGNIQVNGRTQTQIAADLNTLLSAAPFNSGWSTSTTGDKTLEGISGKGFDLDATSGNSAFNFTNVIVSNPEIQAIEMIYYAAAAKAKMERSTDADGAGEMNPGAFSFVEQGVTNADLGFVMSSDFDVQAQNQVDGIKFTQFSSAGAITASNGAKKIGNDIQMDIITLADVTGALASDDELAFMDNSEPGDPTKSKSVSNMLSGFAGSGIKKAASNDKLDLDVDGLGAATIVHNDTLAFHDVSASGTKKGSTQDLAALLSGASEFAAPSNSQLALATGQVALAKLASGTSGQIVVANAASGVPTYVGMSGDVTIIASGAATIGADKVEVDMLKSSEYARGGIIRGDASGDPKVFALGGANTVLKSDGTDLIYSSISNADLANNAAISLTKLASINAGQILVGPAGNGSPAAVTMSGDIVINDSGATSFNGAVIVDADIAGGAAIANSKLANSTISGKALGTDLGNLTVDDVTLQLDSGTTFNGAAGRTISLKSAGIDQSKLNTIEAYHVASAALVGNALVQANLVYGESSSVDNLDKLVSAVSNGSVQSLNRAMCVQVYINGQLLMPDQTGDHSGTFTLGTADYKFIKDGSNIKIVFNGALVEATDVIRITGIALS